ncbi:uncharacterized protein EI97DRAFT_455191 [Westerdykella ornata]|uniref:Avirulence Effector AvrLm4-7 domain-containing protein n=1 Tax=Westerdykella ornata TaxID=318751 RepID=A0A6A6JVM8_WESOR|nr:uncharacterized protein EI97DRAFT_455191 [Westerdykella ornata]KAF2280285.1 hypothetical protein EI97DRAFT_455191 [Westerdykella ornata]
MKNLFLLALPLLASAAAVPAELETRADCKLTAHYRQDWIENALKRFQVKFSVEGGGIPPESFCDAMRAGHCWSAVSNVQCGFDPNLDGGSWRVDVSFVNTNAGYDAYKNCFQESANEWRRVHNTCDVDSRW